MKLKDIKKIAKELGINDINMKKEDLIRAIQVAEGNFDCFGTNLSNDCSQADCLWKKNCSA